MKRKLTSVIAAFKRNPCERFALAHKYSQAILDSEKAANALGRGNRVYSAASFIARAWQSIIDFMSQTHLAHWGWQP